MAPDNEALTEEETPRLIEERCTLHNVPLKEETVSIAYGYLMRELVEQLVEPIFFPLANLMAWSGCCMPGPEKEAQILYCEFCREAKRKWEDAEDSIRQILVGNVQDNDKHYKEMLENRVKELNKIIEELKAPIKLEMDLGLQ